MRCVSLAYSKPERAEPKNKGKRPPAGVGEVCRREAVLSCLMHSEGGDGEANRRKTSTALATNSVQVETEVSYRMNTLNRCER